jgi:hypothetical protein
VCEREIEIEIEIEIAWTCTDLTTKNGYGRIIVRPILGRRKRPMLGRRIRPILGRRIGPCGSSAFRVRSMRPVYRVCEARPPEPGPSNGRHVTGQRATRDPRPPSVRVERRPGPVRPSPAAPACPRAVAGGLDAWAGVHPGMPGVQSILHWPPREEKLPSLRKFSKR